MKKINTLIVFLSLSLAGYSAVHNVQVADFVFTPSMVNAVCGDTIIWNWSSGTHTTTSTSVPSCASSWDAPITISIGTFMYIIPCSGTYNYNCSVHPMMTGLIVATCVTSVEEAVIESPLLYPNPFQDKINVTVRDIDKIALYNVLGKMIMEVKLTDGVHSTSIDASKLPAGLYILSFYKDGFLVETRKVIRK